METTQTTLPETSLFVKMAVSAWKLQNERVDKLLDKLSDEQLQGNIAPGKNSGVYLLGHLVAVNDNLLPLFGFSEKLYPQLQEIFLTNPDKSGLEKPSVADLRKYWHEVNRKLVVHIDEMQPAQWFTRHNSVSEEDFAREPHRNKLNVLLNRTTHQSYHLGQLVLLQKS
jgi:hypothetical protein